MPLIQKDFCQQSCWISPQHQAQILPLIEVSFTGVDAETYFEKYFVSDDAFGRKLRLYFEKDKVVGYCLLTQHKDGKSILVRASAAFYPEHRQGGNTFDFSLLVVAKLKLKYPFTAIYYADTMLSPAMYRAMAKNVAVVYPSKHMDESTEALFLRFNSGGMFSEYAQRTCLVKAGRKTNYSEAEVARFRSNKKQEIAYYCKANPNFDQGVALFVIMPITVSQFLKTALKFMKSKWLPTDR